VHLVQLSRACLLVILLVVSACSTGGADPGTAQRPAGAGSIRGIGPAPDHVTGWRPRSDVVSRDGSGDPPNIVLVVMDDFSSDLLPTLGSAERMRREGASYSHSFTVDSLCCVSRTSLLTGQYPRQTGVRTNQSGSIPHAPHGGFPAYAGRGNAWRSVNVRLQQRGYTTGFVGKFLNQYEYGAGRRVPPGLPGWDSFVPVFGSAYDGWNYWTGRLRRDGGMDVENHPAPPYYRPPGYTSKDLLDEFSSEEFIGSEALRFIRQHRGDDEPYFLEVAPYATHARVTPSGAFPGDPKFPPMFRDRPSDERPFGNCGRVSCHELDARKLPGYHDHSADNTPLTRSGEPAGAWRGRPTGDRPRGHTKLLRDRARMAQSIDRTVQRILDEVGPDTYVVLTSDNGFHIGQNGLGVGKGTAYDTDSRVPLLVVGPGVVPGQRDQLVSNIDLAPTFEELAGVRTPRFRSGQSFARTLARPRAPGRDAVFMEHMGQASTEGDPDAAMLGPDLDQIPSYVAVRSRDSLLVRQDLDPDPVRERIGWEFYSYRDAAWERTNAYADPRHRDEVRRLTGLLRRWNRCRATGDTPLTPSCRRLGGPDVGKRGTSPPPR